MKTNENVENYTTDGYALSMPESLAEKWNNGEWDSKYENQVTVYIHEIDDRVTLTQAMERGYLNDDFGMEELTLVN